MTDMPPSIVLFVIGIAFGITALPTAGRILVAIMFLILSIAAHHHELSP